MTSKGQTIAHIAHAMHFAPSIRTTSCSASRRIAAVGQTCWHGAGSQWRHLLGKAVLGLGPASTWIRFRGVGCSNGASDGCCVVECSTAQANSHWRQPMHRSGLTKTVSISSPLVSGLPGRHRTVTMRPTTATRAQSCRLALAESSVLDGLAASAVRPEAAGVRPQPGDRARSRRTSFAKSGGSRSRPGKGSSASYNSINDPSDMSQNSVLECSSWASRARPKSSAIS